MQFAAFLCRCFRSAPNRGDAATPPYVPIPSGSAPKKILATRTRKHPRNYTRVSNVLERVDLDLGVNPPDLGLRLDLDLHETAPLVTPSPRPDLDGEMVYARVLEVDDSDTLVVVFYAGGKLREERCRLAGITATPTDENTTTPTGARHWLRSKLRDKNVWVECGTWDTKKRLFGTVYLNARFELSVNEEMVREGLARAYDHDEYDAAPVFLER